MFTLFVIFVFVWLFVKSVGLAFHVTWGLAKIAATLLFVIALPLLVVFAILGSLLSAAGRNRQQRQSHADDGNRFFPFHVVFLLVPL